MDENEDTLGYLKTDYIELDDSSIGILTCSKGEHAFIEAKNFKEGEVCPLCALELAKNVLAEYAKVDNKCDWLDASPSWAREALAKMEGTQNV